MLQPQYKELVIKLRKIQRRKEVGFILLILFVIVFFSLVGCVKAEETPLTVLDSKTNVEVEVSEYYYSKIPDGATNIKLIDGYADGYGDHWFTFTLEGNDFLIGMYSGGNKLAISITQIVKEKINGTL